MSALGCSSRCDALPQRTFESASQRWQEQPESRHTTFGSLFIVLWATQGGATPPSTAGFSKLLLVQVMMVVVLSVQELELKVHDSGSTGTLAAHKSRVQVCRGLELKRSRIAGGLLGGTDAVDSADALHLQR